MTLPELNAEIRKAFECLLAITSHGIDRARAVMG